MMVTLTLLLAHRTKSKLVQYIFLMGTAMDYVNIIVKR